jgi:hypothetical protein
MPPVNGAEPTELIYVPSSSWAPVLIAAGVALLAAGTFMGWILWVIGAFVLFLGARSWWRLSNDEISRMRREQATDTAVIPAEPVRR